MLNQYQVQDPHHNQRLPELGEQLPVGVTVASAQEDQAASLPPVLSTLDTVLEGQENDSLLTRTESSQSEVHPVAFRKDVQNNILRVRALRKISRCLTVFFKTCMALIVVGALNGILPHPYLFYCFVPLVINLILCSPLEFLIVQAGKRMARQNDPRLVGPLLDVWYELGQNARVLNIDMKPIETALIRLLPLLTPTEARHLTRENREQMQWFLLFGDSYFFPGQRERSVQLKIAILRALERVGTQEAIGRVSALATQTSDPRLRRAAQECLPYLEARKEESEASQTLLRSSSAQDTADPHLLRPAVETSVASNDLLRPT